MRVVIEVFPLNDDGETDFRSSVHYELPEFSIDDKQQQALEITCWLLNQQNIFNAYIWCYPDSNPQVLQGFIHYMKPHGFDEVLNEWPLCRQLQHECQLLYKFNKETSDV